MFSPVYVRRDPFVLLRRDLDHVLGGIFAPAFGQRTAPRRDCAANFPAMNVSETDEAYHLEAELPGVSRENLEISVVGPELTIKGERKENTPENAAARQREISYGAFTRSLKFRTDLHAEGVEAVFKDGVLKLTLPKAPHSRPRKITINTH